MQLSLRSTSFQPSLPQQLRRSAARPLTKAVPHLYCPTSKQHRAGPMSACPDCIKGSLDDGTPRGEDSTIAGVPCYLTKPTAAAANGSAIILGTDIFGYKLINARLIADAYADAGFICVVPDYFKGEPMDMQLLEGFESLSNQSFFGKIATAVRLAPQIFGFGSWLKRHPISHGVDVATAAAAELREKHGAKKVGLQGYCFGGTVAIMMGSKPGVLDAACPAHPGSVKLPDDVKDINIPMLFICAESDAQFPKKTRTAVQQILDDKDPSLATFILYPGTKHGFAVRGNKQVPAVNAAREDALKQGISFFRQHLAGIPPPAQRLDSTEGAAAAVGKRIVLAPRAC